MCWASGLGWWWSKTLAAFRKRFIDSVSLSLKLPTQSSCSSAGSRGVRVSLSALKAASSRAHVFSCVEPRLTVPQQITPRKRRQTALLKYSGNLCSGSYADDSGLGEIEQISVADKAQEFPEVAGFLISVTNTRGAFYVSEGGRGKGAAKQAREEEERQCYACDLGLKPQSAAGSPVWCSGIAAFLSLMCQTKAFFALRHGAFADHAGVLRGNDGWNPQPWRTLQSKLAVNWPCWDLPLGALCSLCFTLGWGHILLWLLVFLFGVFFLLFDLFLIILLDSCALLFRLVCCSVTGNPGEVGRGSVSPAHVRSADAVTAQTLTPTSTGWLLCALPVLQQLITALWAGGSRTVSVCMYKQLWLCWPTLTLVTKRLKQTPDSLQTFRTQFPVFRTACLLNSKFKSKRNLNPLLFFWSNLPAKVEFLPNDVRPLMLHPVIAMPVWKDILSMYPLRAKHPKPRTRILHGNL